MGNFSKDSLYIAETPDKGRGVFTKQAIRKDTVIELCPIIIIPKSELPIIHKTVLHDYYFLWGEELDHAAIALGFGSIYNHALLPNANFILDFTEDVIEFVAIRDIEAGEEVTVNYNGDSGEEGELWFEEKG